MNTRVLESVLIPSPQEFCVVWDTFFLVVSAVASGRAQEAGPERFGELSVHAARLLRSDAAREEVATIAMAMVENPLESVSLGILYEEMQYLSLKYRDVAERYLDEDMQVFEELAQSAHFFADQAITDSWDALDDENLIGDIDTVAGSIKSILDALPSWIRKAIDAILEALKLTRGG